MIAENVRGTLFGSIAEGLYSAYVSSAGISNRSAYVVTRKKIVVVKESYGNAFVPYLTNNYEEVHVVDLRSFRSTMNTDLATYCRNNGITDVLFINGVMSANDGDRFDQMEALFK